MLALQRRERVSLAPLLVSFAQERSAMKTSRSFATSWVVVGVLLASAGLAQRSLAQGTIGPVFVIAMENHNWTQPGTQTSPAQSSGNANAPYINSRVTECHPNHSPPIFSTDTNGGNDATPANPAAHFYAPLQQFQTDLSGGTIASYNWITPNQFNDQHSALTGGFNYHGTLLTGDAAAIAQGDNFLSIIVPQIMASDAFQNQNGTIIIWNDETEGGDAPSRTIMEIVISKLAKAKAYNSTLRYTHSSDLKTLQALYSIGDSTA